MKTDSLLITFKAICLLLLAHCCAPALLQGQTTHQVGTMGNTFTPATVNIVQGDIVQWTNTGGGFHNVVASNGSFTNGAPATGMWTFSHTFNTVGSFVYYCQIHGNSGGGGMAGTVNVSAPPPPPACTSLSSPANGATNVAVTSGLTWPAATGSPTGYRLDVGTSSGGTNILNNFNVGNVLTHNPAGDFPFNTTIFVKVKPFNAGGSASGCTETSFTTQIAPPNCTSLSSPANAATNVAVTSALTWTAATGSPTGYRLTVGTTSNGGQIMNNVDVGNVTTFDPAGDFPYNTSIFVKITPYNATGNASGCTEQSFTTQIAPPNCTSLSSPANSATNVAVSASLNWAAATGSPTGYRLDVGTSSGGTDIMNNVDVGNVTTFDPAGDFPYNTSIFVKITPYNATGNASGCTEQSFTTQAPPPPNCTSLSSPANAATNVSVSGSLTWAAASGSPTGYRLTVGTSSGGTDIMNNTDVGNVTTFNPPGEYTNNTVIFVKITPYNASGDAAGCTEQSFTTEVCTPNRLLAGTALPPGLYSASGDLTAHTSTVANGLMVLFTSDMGVLLSHDFSVELGGVFEALIQACGN